MFILNGIKFNINAQHVIGDTQYPRGWFLNASERVKLGITEVLDIPRPDGALFNSTENPDGTWTSTPKPLSELKATKLAQLEQARDAAERANVTVAGKVYSASEAFQAKVSRTINQTGRGKPIAGANDAWRTADMQPVVMTAALLGLIEDAITAQSAAAWARFGARFDAVMAATTNEAVDAVTW